MWGRAGAAAIALLVGAAAASPARAQEAPSSSTSSSTSTTATTVVPPGPTLPIDPAASTTSTTTAEDPAANGDAPPESVPALEITVPPRPPAAAYGDQPPFSAHPGRVVRVSSRTARARATETQAALDGAVARVELLGARRQELRRIVAELAIEEREAVEALEVAQVHFEERAVDAYIRGNLGGTRALLFADDATQYAQRLELLEVVVEGDERALRDFEEARQEVDEDQVRTASELASVTLELFAAQDAVEAAMLEHDLASRELAVFLAGGNLVIHGFAFPVADNYAYGDSFGAPRMMGTPYQHWHEGTDIMAPMGTLLVACERGVILRIGTGGVLGGNTVWLRGESGVSYYYAHLSEFADGLREGMVVEPGTVLGFVGDTGNARGGPPHLHFEIHPNGGMAINPYPLLRVAEEQTQPEPIWPDELPPA
jgi:murein DD-endopeptidase MepM/ murein hydrolase activator NlpD